MSGSILKDDDIRKCLTSHDDNGDDDDDDEQEIEEHQHHRKQKKKTVCNGSVSKMKQYHLESGSQSAKPCSPLNKELCERRSSRKRKTQNFDDQVEPSKRSRHLGQSNGCHVEETKEVSLCKNTPSPQKTARKLFANGAQPDLRQSCSSLLLEEDVERKYTSKSKENKSVKAQSNNTPRKRSSSTKPSSNNLETLDEIRSQNNQHHFKTRSSRKEENESPSLNCDTLFESSQYTPQKSRLDNIDEENLNTKDSAYKKYCKSVNSSSHKPKFPLARSLTNKTPEKEANPSGMFADSTTLIGTFGDSRKENGILPQHGELSLSIRTRSSPRKHNIAGTSNNSYNLLLDSDVGGQKSPNKERNPHSISKSNSKYNEEEKISTPNKKNKKGLIDGVHSPLPCSTYLSPLQRKSITVRTPVSKRSSGRGFLTPNIPKKESYMHERPQNALDATRKLLHISTLPKSLPCREKEFEHVQSFLRRKIEHSAGGCMYISGVPGTGKTATVHAVIRSLQQEVDSKELPEFEFVEVNGLRLTEPKQAYVRIYQALSDQKLTPDQAQQLLNKKFSKACKSSTVILVDELDYLCNRRQDVVYNILDWPTKHNASGLVVLTISNTMDLPERTLKGRVTSRMGLTRLMFQPYTHHQLKEIVENRLSGLDTFHPDAVQLVTRKVAAVSGDARRALDICRRTTELVESGQQITVAHVERALSQIFSGPRVVVIQHLSGLGQLVLRALRDVSQRTGVDEAIFRQVYEHLQQICALEDITVPPVGTVLRACVSLTSLGLVMAEKGRMDITRKMTLNVSSDDIHYALDNLKIQI